MENCVCVAVLLIFGIETKAEFFIIIIFSAQTKFFCFCSYRPIKYLLIKSQSGRCLFNQWLNKQRSDWLFINKNSFVFALFYIILFCYNLFDLLGNKFMCLCVEWRKYDYQYFRRNVCVLLLCPNSIDCNAHFGAYQVPRAFSHAEACNSKQGNSQDKNWFRVSATQVMMMRASKIYLKTLLSDYIGAISAERISKVDISWSAISTPFITRNASNVLHVQKQSQINHTWCSTIKRTPMMSAIKNKAYRPLSPFPMKSMSVEFVTRNFPWADMHRTTSIYYRVFKV